MSKFARRRFLKILGGSLGGSAVAAGGGVLYGTRVEVETVETVRRSVPIAGLPDDLEGFRIVLLSDFHLYPHTRLEFIEEVVREANRLKPDLIALTGDFVQGTADAIEDLAPALARLSSRLGIFSVLGNHDIWKGREQVLQGLEREGLEPLVNEGREIQVGRGRLYLAGLDDAWSGRPDLQSALEGAPAEGPVILLAHEPDPADDYCRDPRVTLQLSGHSHGGQVRIPFWGSPFLPPFGRRYDSGLYRVDRMWLYTNRGIGVTVPIRLNCPPEITELTLTGSMLPGGQEASRTQFTNPPLRSSSI